MPDKIVCPECGSTSLVKNGFRWQGKDGNRQKVQVYQCKTCGLRTVPKTSPS